MISKRAFDLFFSVLGLIITAPILILIAILIRGQPPGPVFFRQVRVGRNGAHFRIHKFRTMRWSDSDNGPQITVGPDDRITPIGHFLRKYKLDELPQLIDVALGDMSFVGPRPEVPKYVAQYPDNLRQRILSIRPGITDWSSIHFRDESQLLADVSDPEDYYIKEIIPVKTGYHINYLENMGLLTDINIILQTLFSIGADRR
jgi:lipopolysaccharide/colanic/teichoic acid biosynthesis glycosyltransferase